MARQPTSDWSAQSPIAQKWPIDPRVIETVYPGEIRAEASRGCQLRIVPKVIEPAGDARVSYLGSVTMSRGCDTLVKVARGLRRQTDGGVKLEVIGEAPHPEAEQLFECAAAAGDLTWLGFVRSEGGVGSGRRLARWLVPG